MNHSGAAVCFVAVDECLMSTIEAAKEAGYEAIIIADHGNADNAINQDGTPNTAHSFFRAYGFREFAAHLVCAHFGFQVVCGDFGRGNQDALFVFVRGFNGNADNAINQDGTPNTAHSLNPVPCVYVTTDKNAAISNGKLADVAPTILHIMGLPQPTEMTFLCRKGCVRR